MLMIARSRTNHTGSPPLAENVEGHAPFRVRHPRAGRRPAVHRGHLHNCPSVQLSDEWPRSPTPAKHSRSGPARGSHMESILGTLRETLEMRALCRVSAATHNPLSPPSKELLRRFVERPSAPILAAPPVFPDRGRAAFGQRGDALRVRAFLSQLHQRPHAPPAGGIPGFKMRFSMSPAFPQKFQHPRDSCAPAASSAI